MKIIFLDIDGVLISRKSKRILGDLRTFLPESVGVLKYILEATDARIVISSSWRILKELNQLQEMFTEAGIDGSVVIDITPNVGGTRGGQIDEWLKNTDLSIESFVIIDDDLDIEPYMSQLIKTSFEFGLEMHHAQQAIQMLMDQN